jgi:hypothetical protein
MMGAWFLAGLALVAQANASTGESLPSEVRRLVAQLDAPQLAQRDAAEEALLKLGPQALDLLPPINERTSPEVKLRITRIRQKLQQAAAESTIKPSLITLHGQSMPLAKVLAVLEDQSENKIELKDISPAQSDLRITADFDKMPFWQALDRVLDQTALSVNPYGRQRAIELIGRGVGRRPRNEAVCYSGPLRVEALQVTSQRDFRDPAGNWLRVKLEIAWEPRLQPIGLKQRMRDVLANDENNVKLPVENEQAELEVLSGGRNIAVELTLPLKLPPQGVKEIASLKGTLMALLPGRVETFRFDNLLGAKNVEQRIAEATVTLNRVEMNNGLCQVWMKVRFDHPGEALQSHRLWILQNEAYLVGPDGKPIAYSAAEPTEQTADALGMVYSFAIDGPPAKHTFVYKTPAMIINTGFDYELKGLKLP